MRTRGLIKLVVLRALWPGLPRPARRGYRIFANARRLYRALTGR